MLRYLSDYKRESVLAPLFKMLEATFDLFEIGRASCRERV